MTRKGQRQRRTPRNPGINKGADGPRPRQSPVESSPQKGKSDGPGKIVIISAIAGIGATIVAIPALIMAVLTYVNQANANSAASLIVSEQYASKVSYALEPVHGQTQDLVITNRSTGIITNLVMSFPQPVQGCSAPCEWEANYYATLSNIPACEVLTTNVLGDFSHPSIGFSSLAGSDLVFTDQVGNTWALYGGEYDRLVQISKGGAPSGVPTLPAGGLTQASGCS